VREEKVSRIEHSFSCKKKRKRKKKKIGPLKERMGGRGSLPLKMLLAISPQG